MKKLSSFFYLGKVAPKRSSRAASAKAGAKDTAKAAKLVKTPKAKASSQPITEANAVAIAVDGTGAAKPTNGTAKAKKVVKKTTKKVTKKAPGKVKKTAAVKKQEEKEAAMDEVDVTGGESTVEAEMAEAEEPEPEPEPEPTRKSRRKEKMSKKNDEQDEEEQDDEDQRVRMV